MKMHVSSREYQVRLRKELFGRGERDSEFLDYLAGLDKRVRLRTEPLRRSSFVRELLDTAGRTFGASSLRLRTRSYADRVKATYKAIGPDRYVVARAAIESMHPSAKVKLEEGIYAFHSEFSKQATVTETVGTRFRTVGDWARIFPSASQVAPESEPLVITARADVLRSHKLELDFGSTTTEAMLEVYHSNDPGTPDKVEFSWKCRSKCERFQPEPLELMRAFHRRLNQSRWADPSAHRDKAMGAVK